MSTHKYFVREASFGDGKKTKTRRLVGIATLQDASDSGNGGFTVLGRTHEKGESKELRDAYDTSGVSDELGLFDESRLSCEVS